MPKRHEERPQEDGGAACFDPWPSGAQRINLALQGGGAHGALTWGVLDRLLQDESIAIEGITGASAGAVNGVVTAYGLTVDGRDGARQLLHDVWRRISKQAALSPLQPTPLDRILSPGRMDYSPAFVLLDLMSRNLAPGQFNFLNLDPLRATLDDFIDFEALRSCRTIKLFVNATNVRRGRMKIFHLDEISLDAVMASACVPMMQPAVEIDGEAYWDGGFMGNPAIYPLINETECSDILLVQLNPINIDHTPDSAREILDRLNTITFNAGLMREMRAIQFVTGMIDRGFDDGGRLRRLYFHVIDAEDVMQDLGVSSKLNADWEFLTYLRDIGSQRTEAWLIENRAKLGKESTLDIASMYL